jgi:4-hydroxymandelate oxidase
MYDRTAEKRPGAANYRLLSMEVGELRATPVSVRDTRGLAREMLPGDVWDFVEGGAEEERALAANEAAFSTITVRQRAMTDVSRCDTATTLLGRALAAPIGIAPTAYQRLVHPDGEVATARGAAGALVVVSVFASCSLEEIAAAATGPLWLQMYWLHRRDVMAGLIAHAERAGFDAIVLTVDVPRLGRRWRDMRNGFAVPADIRAVNVDAALLESAHHADAGVSGIATHASLTHDPSLTWADLAWLRERTALPIVLKGILTGADGALAVAHGADAVIVSNHGGRQLDGAPASLTALPEVVASVAGRVPVLLDGGVRRGQDVFVARALGADAVLLGRPPLWGLAVGGAEGVADVLRTVRVELEHTMALAGRPTLADVDRAAVAPYAPI